MTMYLIGLTGNIASGKSTVAHILEQLGARVIDADLVAHSVLKRGSPAWRGVVDAFGYDILHYDGSIDRRRLGSVVFADASKLEILERITHPAVGTELALLIRDGLAAHDANDAIVVIEAVKLYEAGLHEYLDALWVVTTPFAEQKRRLMQDRSMTEADADSRLRAQPSLDEKLKHAVVVIDNGGSIEETRVQVMRAFVGIDPAQASDKTELLEHWLRLKPNGKKPALPETVPATSPPSSAGEWLVRRARPGDAQTLAKLVAQIEGNAEPLSREEMLKRQGKLGYWLVRSGDQIVALAAWQAENLAAIVQELWAQDKEIAARTFPLLLEAIQTEANSLTCEVVVIIAPPRAADFVRIAAEASGYQTATLHQLHKLWRSVVEPMLQGDEVIYTKHLRAMVMDPI